MKYPMVVVEIISNKWLIKVIYTHLLLSISPVEALIAVNKRRYLCHKHMLQTLTKNIGYGFEYVG